MITIQVLDDLKIIEAALLSIKSEKTEKAYQLLQEIKKELKWEQNLFGKTAWALEDIANLFRDQKEKVPPKKILRQIADELDDTVAGAMCEIGWEIIIGYVQDFISARKKGGK